MAAAEEKCDMMTIADIDEQLAKQLTDELFEKGFIKKGKASDVTSVINEFQIEKPDLETIFLRATKKNWEENDLLGKKSRRLQKEKTG